MGFEVETFKDSPETLVQIHTTRVGCKKGINAFYLQS